MSPQFNVFHSNLHLNGRCPVCNTMYDLQKFKIIAEREQNVLTYIQCSSCGSAVLSMLTAGQQGLQAVGLVTDLTLDEVIAFEGNDAVGPDDVIALHDRLMNDRSIIPPFTNPSTKQA
jgi:hypothetical protein